jgi:hypothetical protein
MATEGEGKSELRCHGRFPYSTFAREDLWIVSKAGERFLRNAYKNNMFDLVERHLGAFVKYSIRRGIQFSHRGLDSIGVLEEILID